MPVHETCVGVDDAYFLKRFKGTLFGGFPHWSEGLREIEGCHSFCRYDKIWHCGHVSVVFEQNLFLAKNFEESDF